MSAAAATATRRPAARRRGSALRAIGWVGGAIVGGFAAIALLAPVLAPHDVHAIAGEQLHAPSGAHLLGTNAVGQDVFSQMLAGTRASLLVALLAGGGTLVLGTLVGTVAGWLGGTVEALLMRIVDAFLVVPRIPLVIVIAAYAGLSIFVISAIIALTSWPPGARVVRSQVLSLRSRAHLRAAVGFGAGTLYVLRRHVLPEIALILAAGLVAAAERAVVLEAGLAFLGLGDATRKRWGSIMRDALDFEFLFFTDAWAWWLVSPVAALCLLLLGITFVGIALERTVNPRISRHPVGVVPVGR